MADENTNSIRWTFGVCALIVTVLLVALADVGFKIINSLFQDYHISIDPVFVQIITAVFCGLLIGLIIYIIVKIVNQ